MKKSLFVLPIIIVALGMMSFIQTNTNKDIVPNVNNDGLTGTIGNENTDPAYVLMKNKCLICHDAGTGRETMIAPPMLRVKQHYMEDEISKEEFIKNIKTWVTNPTEDKILMPGAVDKFKMMPMLPYSNEDLEAIAAYMYDNELASPSWWGQKQGQGNGKGKNNQATQGDCGSEKGNGTINHGWKKIMTLDNNKRWIANKETTNGILKMKKIVANNLALEKMNQDKVNTQLIDAKNEILKQCNMKGKSHDTLHLYLSSLGEKINKITMVKSEKMAKIILQKIDKQLNDYATYFK